MHQRSEKPSKVHRNFKLESAANDLLVARGQRQSTTQTAIIEKLITGDEIMLGEKARTLLLAEAQRRNQKPIITLEALVIQALAQK